MGVGIPTSYEHREIEVRDEVTQLVSPPFLPLAPLPEQGAEPRNLDFEEFKERRMPKQRKRGDRETLSTPASAPPPSSPFGSPLFVTLAKAFPLSALSFPICTRWEGLRASLSSAFSSGPELVNSGAGCWSQLVKGGRVAGGPLWCLRGWALVPAFVLG